MKVRKIIVILTSIIIILMGIIYNLLNTTILNNKKMIIKEMSETEYETNISSLNQSHTDYANNIQASKEKIASAITDMGVATSDETTLETMANNIKSIARNASSISYDNTNSELTSNNVQGAVDELSNSLTNLNEEYVMLASTTSTKTTNVVTVDNLNNYKKIALYLGSTTDINTSSFINYVEIPTSLFINTSGGLQTRYSDQNYAGAVYISDTSVKFFTRSSGQIAVLYGVR